MDYLPPLKGGVPIYPLTKLAENACFAELCILDAVFHHGGGYGIHETKT